LRETGYVDIEVKNVSTPVPADCVAGVAPDCRIEVGEPVDKSKMAPNPDGLDRAGYVGADGKFDRKAYQRAYMRDYMKRWRDEKRKAGGK
jgi:hypothetical protein